MNHKLKTKRIFIKTSFACALFFGSHFGLALASDDFQYKNEFSTQDEVTQLFGLPPSYNQNNPSLHAGSFQFEVGSGLECGNIDFRANINGQFRELQRQIKKLVPTSVDEAKQMLTASAFVTICYAYPTLCAQLRHDWLSIQGKLNLRAQACAAVDKYIDSQADRGARQLKAQAQADCVRSKAGAGGDIAAALEDCQQNTGLRMRDFQTGMMRAVNGQKQRVLKAIVSFAKDDSSYEFLRTLLGEIQVNTSGQWEPLFERGLLRPADVSDSFLTRGQILICTRLREIHANRFVTSDTYEKEVAVLVRQRIPLEVQEDLEVLAQADKRIACLALGRAVGKEAALKASAHYESLVSTGLLNTAIPESLRKEYRERSLAAFPAVRQALESEEIPSVDKVRADLSLFAQAQRAKSALMAQESNRGKLMNTQSDNQARSDCTDSLTCQ